MYLLTKGEAKVIKTKELLKTNHVKQIAWLNNQIEKGNNSIFLNYNLAKSAWKDLNEFDLILEDSAIEDYMERYLSPVGKKKLITTLRVALNRAKNPEKLQVNLNGSSGDKLKYLKDNAKTKMTKQEIINILIQKADLSIFEDDKPNQKEEEQLEIKL